MNMFTSIRVAATIDTSIRHVVCSDANDKVVIVLAILSASEWHGLGHYDSLRLISQIPCRKLDKWIVF